MPEQGDPFGPTPLGGGRRVSRRYLEPGLRDLAAKAKELLALIPLAGLADVGSTLTSVATDWTAGRRFVPVGVISMWGAAVPSGWLECDGTAVSRTTYADLFAVLGTTWGAGDGTTTFNLPDMRGRAPIGAGTGSGLTARTLAAATGGETTTLAVGNMPAHDHGAATGSTSTAHTHPIDIRTSVTEAAGFGLKSPSDGFGDRAMVTGSGTSTQAATSTAHTHSVSSQGSGTAFTIMQPSVVVRFIIKT